ncbi:hypothetical protein NECID01_2073 [Nematocida sp. AWRm77]|nr:hypothetical protein NECID01_2073 [Nematocida sp. AWRm77]
MRKEWAERSLTSAIRVPEDFVLYGVGITLYCVFLVLVKRYLSEIMIQKLRNSSKKTAIPMQKFTRALWKMVCFSIMFGWGVHCLWGDNWMFSALGITFEWPGNNTPWKINAYYVLETVYYSGSFVTMFFEEKQSDFYLMIWHHFVTLVLIGFSYHYNFLRYGAFLMFLHDASDPWMECAKLAVYLGYQTLGNVLFVVFTIMFIVPRIFVYSVLVLIPGYTFLWEYQSKLLVPIWGLLVAVFLLNLYWSMLILRMLYDFLSKGKVDKDIRDIEKKGARRTKKPAGRPKQKVR